MKVESIPLARVRWRPSCRIIPTRFPATQLYERVAEPEDLEAVFSVEALTNNRLRNEINELELVPPDERITGPGSSFIMSAFTRLNPAGSRFSDGSFGVYYCAHREATAIAETVHHRAQFLASTDEPACELDMLVLHADVNAELHDLRAVAEPGSVLDPDDYSAGQQLGQRLKTAGAWGIVYPSVRDAGGECAAVLRPRALARLRPGRHLCYVWDGRAITQVYEKRGLRELGHRAGTVFPPR
jgi:hypothetical protein